MKKYLALALTAAMILSMAMVTFADNGKSTVVKYTVAPTSFEWSVPTAQELTLAGGYKTNGAVQITPAATQTEILIPAGKKIEISAASGNSWKLKNGASEIAYTMATASETGAQIAEAPVLTFIGGTSTKTGVSQTVYFWTDAAKVSAATAAGEHKDIITFTMTTDIPE